MTRINRRRARRGHEIDPEDIFLDSSNLPDFDVDQFEGRFEKPITKRTVLLLGVFFIAVFVVFVGRVGILQLVKGDAYAAQSENNRLAHTPIFAERGVIYDRNGLELAWNAPGEDVFPKRVYAKMPGIAHTLGYVDYPAVDSSGFYYRTEYEGRDGVEAAYNGRLGGESGLKIVETDALMRVRSESVVKPPRNGDDLVLSIDAELQSRMYELIRSLAAERGFESGSGVIMDTETGEVLTLTSFPEYDSNVLTEGEDANAIARLQANPGKPFLNRAVSGLYTPGSVVKLFVAIGALNEGVITPDKKILSTGSISIPNPYYPDLKTVFNDWKAHGWVDVKEALAVSSDVYFYEVGGGFEDQKGIGIEKIKAYAEMFGLGKLTGVDIAGDTEGTIPDPAWKAEKFDGEPWRIGNTYHTAIGQYGFQLTPLQLVRGIAAIANKGTLVTPRVVRGAPAPTTEVKGVSDDIYNTIHEGMRLAVTAGTAKNLYIPQVKVAAKTGTAEVGVLKKKVNSWITGFFPYEEPRYAFAVVMGRGPSENIIGGLFVMRQLLDWMSVNRPEYLHPR